MKGMNKKSKGMRNLIIAIFTLLIIMSPMITAIEPQGKYFDITIIPEKEVFSPNEFMEVNIIVRDKTTNKPVMGAEVTGNISIYQGSIIEKLKIPAKEGRGIYLMEQKLITMEVGSIPAVEREDGIYTLKEKIDTKARWGGLTLRVTVAKDGHQETVTRGISFMSFNVWFYALGVTSLSIVIGLGIGFISGGFHR